jgi:glycosyltransferase involved in cell wall biosynthesis
VKSINLLEIIYTLGFGGAERLAATICQNLDKSIFHPKVCALYGGHGPLTESLNRGQIPYFSLQGEALRKLTFLKTIYNSIKRENVSLIHVHGFYLLLQCLLPAKLAGVKIVYTEHANFTIRRFKKYSLLASFFPHFVDRMTTVSSHLKNYFVNGLRVPSSKIEVIYNGVDLNKFKYVHDSLPRTDNNIVQIGTVGRLSEPKDHKTLLKALKIVNEIRDDFHLTIVGDGELRPFFEKTVKEMKIENHVSLLGSRDDIPQILSTFDIFVLSSKREGLPIALLEAMACGKPVIVTKVGGIPEVIIDGNNGILVDPENPGSLAEKMGQLLSNSFLREKLAKEAYNTVEASFSLEKMMRSYQDLFLSIVN